MQCVHIIFSQNAHRNAEEKRVKMWMIKKSTEQKNTHTQEIEYSWQTKWRIRTDNLREFFFMGRPNYQISRSDASFTFVKHCSSTVKCKLFTKSNKAMPSK